MVIYGTNRRVRQLMTVSMNCKNCQKGTIHTLRRAQKKCYSYNGVSPGSSSSLLIAYLAPRHRRRCE